MTPMAADCRNDQALTLYVNVHFSGDVGLKSEAGLSYGRAHLVRQRTSVNMVPYPVCTVPYRTGMTDKVRWTASA